MRESTHWFMVALACGDDIMHDLQDRVSHGDECLLVAPPLGYALKTLPAESSLVRDAAMPPPPWLL